MPAGRRDAPSLDLDRLAVDSQDARPAALTRRAHLDKRSADAISARLPNKHLRERKVAQDKPAGFIISQTLRALVWDRVHGVEHLLPGHDARFEGHVLAACAVVGDEGGDGEEAGGVDAAGGYGAVGGGEAEADHYGGFDGDAEGDAHGRLADDVEFEVGPLGVGFGGLGGGVFLSVAVFSGRATVGVSLGSLGGFVVVVLGSLGASCFVSAGACVYWPWAGGVAKVRPLV